jgi:hypothetical protein
MLYSNQCRKCANLFVDKFAQLVRGRALGAVYDLGAAGMGPRFFEQPPDRTNADIRAVITLRKRARALRAGYDANSQNAAFKGMENILGVDLAAARNFLYPYVHSGLAPLHGQKPDARETIPAKENQNFGSSVRRRIGHRLLHIYAAPSHRDHVFVAEGFFQR